MRKALVCLLLFAFSHSFSQTFTLSDTQFKVGSYYRTYDISFDLDKVALRPESKVTLDSIVIFLNKFPNIKIEVGVHSDSRGSEIANNNLTYNRAQRVFNYFISNKIDSFRLIAKGYGEVKPIISDIAISKLKTHEEKEAAYQKNRRVEFKITAIDGHPFKLTDTKFELGDYFRTNRIWFDLSQCSIRPECMALMDSISDFMKANTNLKFEIGTHTDSRGSADHNIKVSQCRANMLLEYLMTKGIDTSRLIAIGYGETKPIVPDIDISKLKTLEEKENAYQKNRRVEFKIIAI